MGRNYRVGEVAKRFAVSKRTLRHYDERGLLTPSARGENGSRLYTDDDLARLVEILSLRARIRSRGSSGPRRSIGNGTSAGSAMASAATSPAAPGERRSPPLRWARMAW